MFNLALLGKYRNIVISVALFLLLDTSVLIFNFYVSFEIAEDAAGVNLAGRQRMLSQRMSKSLFDLAYSFDNEAERSKALSELEKTTMLFNTTFNAFENGGEVTSASGERVMLEAVNTNMAINALTNANNIWENYYPKLQNVIAGGVSLSSQALNDTILFAKQSNLSLLNSMNDLTVELERIASSKAKRLRLIQTIGISLAIINFLIIMFHFLKQLRESDKKIESARKETAEILDTVNEGLFLIDDNRTIGSQYSTRMESLFNQQDIAGKTIEHVLEPILSSKDLSNTKRFIALLYRDDIKSKLIKDLNPLSEVSVNIYSEDERYVNKYLSFMFERVYEGDEIKDILVTVNDVTDRVQLEKELEVSRDKNERQLEVLTGILHADPKLTHSFIMETFSTLNDINKNFKKPSKTSSSLYMKLNEVASSIHKIKGDSAALNLQSFEDLCHDFESKIAQAKTIENINGDDFIPLALQLEKLLNHTESIQVLTNKLKVFSVGGESHSISSSDINNEKEIDIWKKLYDLTSVVNKRQEKNTRLICSGLNSISLDSPFYETISIIAIQCIRNAIVHSIELPEKRIELKKPAVGRIDIRVAIIDHSLLEVTIEDDGNGIDYQKIRERMIANKSSYSEKDINKFDNLKLISSIFNDEFSTSDNQNKDAGRGMGMGLIKKEVLGKNGRVNIKNSAGKGVKFIFTLPINSNELQA